MKTQNILIIGALGLGAAYLLLRKQPAQAQTGTFVEGNPTPTLGGTTPQQVENLKLQGYNNAEIVEKLTALEAKKVTEHRPTGGGDIRTVNGVITYPRGTAGTYSEGSTTAKRLAARRT